MDNHCCGPHLGVGGVRPGIGNIVADGVVEEDGVLRHHADGAPQRLLGHLANVLLEIASYKRVVLSKLLPYLSVNEDSALLHVIEAEEEPPHRTLARPSRTDLQRWKSGIGKNNAVMCILPGRRSRQGWRRTLCL